MGNGGMGNGEWGMGNGKKELSPYSPLPPITDYRLPITDYQLPIPHSPLTYLSN
ncbi:alpha/beta hydrolase [Hassallia byssoidea VB512170]|uniref:Alpha/beta hydrolase n=1 Tax=Hassallia byssoidea VB512170 TaxID=1304833 RepID=A0A846HIC7_9CYAN|nr:alpha/beta hydrolase [Hassalia byssoidea]NEU76813.1 alpha/beta hydrolase [Hassalia byssoidea VB512170]